MCISGQNQDNYTGNIWNEVSIIVYNNYYVIDFTLLVLYNGKLISYIIFYLNKHFYNFTDKNNITPLVNYKRW